MKNIEYEIKLDIRVLAEQDSEKIKKLIVEALYNIMETTNVCVDNYNLKKVSLVEIDDDD